MSTKKKLLVILGPTSTGKTDIAIYLAKKFNGELIACDSRQIYTGLDLGSGKLPGKKIKVKKGKGYWELNGIKIWMYDLVDPKQQYTVADYVVDARRIIQKISKRQKLPIIVGGTGFYLKALLEDIPNLAVPLDEALRNKLIKLSKEDLQKKLQEVAFNKWTALNESDRENPRRLIRAIELSLAKPIKKTYKTNNLIFNNWSILKVGLTAPRQILYQRIDERVINRINQGMIDEAECLHKKGLTLKRMKQLGLEYGVLAEYISGVISKNELVIFMQNKIHNFARRQITWYKKEKNINWVDITCQNYFHQVVKLLSKWYYMKI